MYKKSSLLVREFRMEYDQLPEYFKALPSNKPLCKIQKYDPHGAYSRT